MGNKLQAGQADQLESASTNSSAALRSALQYLKASIAPVRPAVMMMIEGVQLSTAAGEQCIGRSGPARQLLCPSNVQQKMLQEAGHRRTPAEQL
jgi:hypothetical protein